VAPSGWQQQTVRVAVPIDQAQPKPDKTHDVRGDVSRDVRGSGKRLEEAIVTLSEGLKAANVRADRAEARADQAEAANRELQTRLEAERTRADHAEGTLDGIKAERAAADMARGAAPAATEADRPGMVAARIDEVQLRRLQEAEQVRKSLGLLARLRLAWRGE
jgi:hypothetical protein